MMPIRIETAGQDANLLASFLALPDWLYRDQVNRAPPASDETARLLDPARCPYWRRAERELFVAWRDGRAVGRILAIDDPGYDRARGERAGLFGLFECVEDLAVARALLDAARRWLLARGCQVMRGPFNPFPDTLDCGLLVEGFAHAQVFNEPWHPDYYRPLFERLGLIKLVDYLSLRMAMTEADNPDGNRKNARLERYFASGRRVSARPLDPARIAADLAIVDDILRATYRDDPVLSAWNPEMQSFLRKRMFPMDDWRLCFIAERAGEPAGVWMVAPDYREALRQRGRTRIEDLTDADLAGIRGVCVLDLAILPRFRGTQVASALIHAFWDTALAQGRTHNHVVFVREDNAASLTLAETYGAVPTKRFRLYETRLTESASDPASVSFPTPVSTPP